MHFFHRTNFHKLFLTKHSAHNCFKTHGQAFQAHGQVSEALRQNEKLGREFENLGRVFKKLGRVFVLQHGPCCPNQPRYLISICTDNLFIYLFIYFC